jgi:hypothetical protein
MPTAGTVEKYFLIDLPPRRGIPALLPAVLQMLFLRRTTNWYSACAVVTYLKRERGWADMILVIESKHDALHELVRTVRWIDGRHRVEASDNAFDAFRIASRLRPGIIVVGSGLGLHGLELAQKIRAAFPGVLLIAVGKRQFSPGEDDPMSAFDAVLDEPLDHTRIDALLASRRGRRSREFNDDEPRIRKKRVVQPRVPRLHVTVRLNAESENLKFKVAATEGISVGSLLQQLGKHSVEWYRLFRNTDELNVNLETVLQDGDELCLRATNPDQPAC